MRTVFVVLVSEQLDRAKTIIGIWAVICLFALMLALSISAHADPSIKEVLAGTASRQDCLDRLKKWAKELFTETDRQIADAKRKCLDGDPADYSRCTERLSALQLQSTFAIAVVRDDTGEYCKAKFAE